MKLHRLAAGRAALPFAVMCVLVASAAPAEALQNEQAPLALLVLDPLARQNACACVAGYAQRDYKALGQHLTNALKRPVEVSFAADPEAGANDLGRDPDIVIGKCSAVEAYAARKSKGLRLVAILTDQQGSTTQQGLFVVRTADRARGLADLKWRKVLFGPADEVEKSGAALAALRAAGVKPPARLESRPNCNIAGLAVVDRQADAAAISGYALPLLSGCGTIKAGALRVVGRTKPVPFVGAFVSTNLDAALQVEIAQALRAVNQDADLKRKLESRDGFKEVPPQRRLHRSPGPPAAAGWTDWRGGPARDGLSPAVPSRLPAQAHILWRKAMASQSLGGLSATGQCVIVSDKSADKATDIWRCLDAADGHLRWEVSYPARGKMDYTNAPRASPVIVGDMVYLLGAFGHLAAARMGDGQVVWSCDLPTRFGATVPTWGYCGTPLVVDGKVIVMPGSRAAAMAALDRVTGRTLWTTPGNPPAYGNLIVATLGGRRQIVGHDSVSLGGWNIATGRRLWTLKPPQPRDFNVPTPVVAGGKLLVATENNGARLYAFGKDGRIVLRPTAVCAELRSNTVSPIALDGAVWGGCDGGLFCLDPASGLKPLWKSDEGSLTDHLSLIGGSGHVLVTAKDGRLFLLPSRPTRGTRPQSLTVFPVTEDSELAVWSHPALVGSRLYLRTDTEIVCLSL